MPSACSGRALRAVTTLVALALACAGCTTTFTARPFDSCPVTDDPVLRAGVWRVDITPAPGLAMFGHGPEGRVSRGILLRLHCTAVVLTRGTEALALVPCDLAAPSLLLQRSIAIQLRQRHPDVPLGADRIVLSATHTHAGPAHYFGAGNYAGPLSTRGEQGTSAEVVSFLAMAIADGVARAWAERKPAALAWSHAEVGGLTKNRSMEAFALDAPKTADGTPRDRMGAFVDAALASERPALVAVDRGLSVLRIDAVAPAAPLAVVAYFGSHPTGIPNTNDLYHGDTFGYAARAVFEREGDPACGAGCPVVALVNGLSGDVSPAVDEQGPREARRWGHDLAGHIRTAWLDAGTRLDPAAKIELAFREVDLVSAPVASIEEVTPRPVAGRPAALAPWVTPCACNAERTPRTCGAAAPQPQDVEACKERPTAPECASAFAMCACTCDHASVGAAASGGAPDGLTAFHFIDGFRAGARIERDACHAPKIEITGLGDCSATFPRTVPIWSIRLGGALVVTFPAEVTTIAGMRAVERVSRELAQRSSLPGDASLRVVPATLVGDWIQYLATEEEYPSQQYEGASTLWGPASARFFERQVSCLAGYVVDESLGRDKLDAICRLGQPAPFEMTHVEFEVPTASLRPRPLGCASTDAAALVSAPGVGPQRVDSGSKLAGVSLAVRDGERGFQATYFPPPGCGTQRHVPRVSIVDAVTGHAIDDDDGDGIELRSFANGIGGRVGPRGLEVTAPGWLVSWFPSASIRRRLCSASPAAPLVKLRVSLARAPVGLAAAQGGKPAPIVVESAPFAPCE